MLVLLTTANFPDIMLPAYYRNYWNALFFIGYMCFGLFFLTNILLANIFAQFRQRLEKVSLHYIQKQDAYLHEYIGRFD